MTTLFILGQSNPLILCKTNISIFQVSLNSHLFEIQILHLNINIFAVTFD